MTGYNRQAIGLAIGLACLAGYIDASGYLSTGVYFVSFMSGNSTFLGIGLAEGRLIYASCVFGVVLLFILGVIAGTVVSRVADRRRKPAVLLLVGSLLLIAAAFRTAELIYPSIISMVLSMGAVNAVFQRDGEVSIGLTYMTGTLVKLGQKLAGIFFGGPKDTWLPYALHWTGLVVGASLGSWSYLNLRFLNLWPAVCSAFLFCLFSLKLVPVKDK